MSPSRPLRSVAARLFVGAAQLFIALAILLFLGFAYVTWTAGPLVLTDRAQAFTQNMPAYDGVDAGALSRAPDWNVVCVVGAYLTVSGIDVPPGFQWRHFDPGAPITFGDDVGDRDIPEGYSALVYLSGNEVVDYMLMRNAVQIDRACIEEPARFRWRDGNGGQLRIETGATDP